LQYIFANFSSKEKNAMECISQGSLSAVNVVTAVLANLISFVALMALISGVIGYAGSLLGHPDWSLEMFFGYAFAPIAYLIGVTDSVEQTMVIWGDISNPFQNISSLIHFRLSAVCWVSKLQSAISLRTSVLATFSTFFRSFLPIFATFPLNHPISAPFRHDCHLCPLQFQQFYRGRHSNGRPQRNGPGKEAANLEAGPPGTVCRMHFLLYECRNCRFV
jgi:hypothetical protein